MRAVLTLHPVGKLRQMGLDFGERKCVAHTNTA